MNRSTTRGSRGGVLLLAAGASLATPAVVVAHHPGAIPPEPTAASFLLGWSFEPAVVAGLALAAAAWLLQVRRVNAAHPAAPVPRARSIAFLGGLGVIAVALLSGIARYDTVLFSVHMMQHVLLMLVAAPLIVLGAPVTLLLRAATGPVRRRWILPVLHSRIVRVLAHPVVAWVAFAGVGWAAHFSPLFNSALEDPLLHDLEHALFLGAALLFWWPAIGLDPVPWRMSRPVRALYVFLQMPQNTFLGVAISFAAAPLYANYAELSAPWLPAALADQQIAGGIMWLAGDVLFLGAIFGLLVAWMRAEEHDAVQEDRRADASRAAIREREVRLAERLERERGSPV